MVNFSLRCSLRAVWVTPLVQLICEAGMLVTDTFKNTWSFCIEAIFNPASWGADQGKCLQETLLAVYCPDFTVRENETGK